MADQPEGKDGIHVALLDGDEEVLKESGQNLIAAGFQVHPFSNAKAAIRRLDTTQRRAMGDWKPGIIVVDVSLGGMSGYEAVRQLVYDFKYEDIPVLMTARYPTSEDTLEASNAGARGLLSKPVDAEKLQAAIENFEMRKLKRQIGEQLFDFDYS